MSMAALCAQSQPSTSTDWTADDDAVDSDDVGEHTDDKDKESKGCYHRQRSTNALKVKKDNEWSVNAQTCGICWNDEHWNGSSKRCACPRQHWMQQLGTLLEYRFSN